MGGGHSPDSPSPTRNRLGRVCPVGCRARLRSPLPRFRRGVGASPPTRSRADGAWLSAEGSIDIKQVAVRSPN